ncbi:MAG: metal-dependent transcriptional regulator [bacterium]
MNRKREKEEYLERLWQMKEQSKHAMEDLKNGIDTDFNIEILNELSDEDLVEIGQDHKNINLTPKGEEHARGIIRAHRLAERLFYDVLGYERESGACEFEHTVTPELVDGICILLGHPRQCPHGNPIPAGNCCRQSARTAESSVIPLTELDIAQSARVAYVNFQNDQQLHKIDGLNIRPGKFVKLHQRYPCYVIECEGANIAMDEEIVSSIYVWRKPPIAGNVKKGENAPRNRFFGGFRQRHRKRGN